MARGFDLSAYGISAPDVLRNASLGLLYEDGVVCDGDWITSQGALATTSGDRTTFSRRDLRIVADESEAHWNAGRLIEKSHDALRKQAVDYFNTCGRLYVVEGKLGRDPRWQLRVRAICARPSHATFLNNLLIRPSAGELRAAEPPELVIFNAGQLPAEPKTPGLTSGTSVSLHPKRGEIVVLGTEYAGEMVRALFVLWQHKLQSRSLLAVHGSACQAAGGEVSLLLGGPGAGKSTLAALTDTTLIGDDLVGWADDGIFGVGSSCYPRCRRHTSEPGPELAQALGFGALLENVVVDSLTRRIDFSDTSVAEHPRAAIPLERLGGKIGQSPPKHPAHAILLIADAQGVLPLVGRLSPEQALYHMLCGYAPKMTVSETGELVPQVAFAPCFDATAVSGDPVSYASQLVERLRTHATQLWLINTGWTADRAGTGDRVELQLTRTILKAIQSGALTTVETITDPIFGLQIPKQVPGVPGALLKPEGGWSSIDAYRQAAAQLAEQFQRQFQQFASAAPAGLRQAGPRVPLAVTA